MGEEGEKKAKRKQDIGGREDRNQIHSFQVRKHRIIEIPLENSTFSYLWSV